MYLFWVHVFALAINHCSRGARLMWFTCLLWNCSLPPKDSSTWIVLRKRRLAIFYGAPLFAIRSVNITQKLFKFSFIVQFQKILSILPTQKDCFFRGLKASKILNSFVNSNEYYAFHLIFLVFETPLPQGISSPFYGCMSIKIFCNFTFAQARDWCQRTIPFHGGHGSFL